MDALRMRMGDSNPLMKAFAVSVIVVAMVAVAFIVYDSDGATPATATPFSGTVSFDANGGSGVPESFEVTGWSDEIHPNECTLTFTMPDTVPTRSGCTFLGWSTDTDGTTLYQPGQEISSEWFPYTDSTVTFYAIWQHDPDGSREYPYTDDVTITKSDKNKTIYMMAGKTIIMKFNGSSSSVSYELKRTYSSSIETGSAKSGMITTGTTNVYTSTKDNGYLYISSLSLTIIFLGPNADVGYVTKDTVIETGTEDNPYTDEATIVLVDREHIYIRNNATYHIVPPPGMTVKSMYCSKLSLDSYNGYTLEPRVTEIDGTLYTLIVYPSDSSSSSVRVYIHVLYSELVDTNIYVRGTFTYGPSDPADSG